MSTPAQAAAAALRSPPTPLRAVVGFDGFVDSITKLVSRRRSMTLDDYEPIRTIPEFAARCAAAAGLSTNIERVVLEDRFGGNGPLMASGLMALGCEVSFLGSIGASDEAAVPKGVFEPFAARCSACVCLGAPGHTEAFEFDDGKLMLNETGAVQRVDWARLMERVGLERLRSLLNGAAILGMVNWSLCGGVESIWHGLTSEVLPGLACPPRVFVDLSDPAKRTDEDVARGLGLLRSMNELAPVTLGLNLSEAVRVAHVIDAPDHARAPAPERLPTLARNIRMRTGLAEIVIHPREGAAGASERDEAWCDGPFTDTPRLSTGAGDHFNAGFAWARARGLSLASALHVATAVSGAYVRDAGSPGGARAAELLDLD